VAASICRQRFGFNLPQRYSEEHLLIGTDLTFEEVVTIARRENWIARHCDRNFFSLLGLWVENRFLVEEVATVNRLGRVRVWLLICAQV